MRLLPFLALPSVLIVGAAAPAGAPSLDFPVACQLGRDCEIQQYVDRDPGPAAKDFRCGRRANDGHTGIDIRVPDMAAQRRGVAVLAAAPGRVARLRDGVQDFLMHAPGAPPTAGQECGNGVVIDHGGGWETQYCHLAQGSVRVRQGDAVQAGQPIGRVGFSGAADFPHLHLQVRHEGKVVDPFAPDPAAACSVSGATGGLWSSAARRQVAYKPGAVLNLGFAGAAVDMAQIEDARTTPVEGGAFLVGYGRAISLERGDVLQVSLSGPSGVLAQSAVAPLERDKAQYFLMAGKRRPAGGWTAGAYVVELRVVRAGKVALSGRRTLTLGSGGQPS